MADGDETTGDGADILYRRMQQRGAKTRAEIMAANEIPLERELIAAVDTREVWLGDGVTPVSELPTLRDGTPGEPGSPGDNGDSAYQIWLSQGNEGTEADFLESLIARNVAEPDVWFLDAYQAFLSGWSFQPGQGIDPTTAAAQSAAASSTLTVTSGAAFPTGTVLVIGEGTAQQQINKVSAGGGTATLTLTRPLAFDVAAGAQVTPLWGDSKHMNTLGNRAGWRAFARFIMESRRPDGARVINRTGKVVFLGNSWMTAANSDAYTSAVQAVYPAAVVVMAGVSGNNSGQILARFDADCPADADFVVIPEPGVNAAGSESRVLQMANLNALIAKVRGIGATPVFTGPVPLSDTPNVAAVQEADQTAALADASYLGVGQATPSGSTAYGSRALENDTRDSNTALGTSALRNNTTGAGNTAVGQFAGIGNTTGSLNTALGQAALQNNTTGSNNTAVGVSALAASTGSGSVGVGRYALFAVTSNNNTAVGDEALRSATTGGFNTGLGRRAGASETTGGSNVAVGAFAADQPNFVAANASTTASEQVVVGAYAGQASATQRSGITAVGAFALVDGADATAVGSRAQALHTRAVALGKSSATTAPDQVAIKDRHIEMLVNRSIAPSNAAPDGARVFVRDNGSGKMQLAVVFPSGSAVTLATEA